jgi:hypothetical protein
MPLRKNAEFASRDVPLAPIARFSVAGRKEYATFSPA